MPEPIVIQRMSDASQFDPKGEGKTAGAQDGGKYAGWYGNKFCKSEPGVANKICEGVFAELARALDPAKKHTFANVSFAFSPDVPTEQKVADETGENVYVVSERIPEFEAELFAHAFKESNLPVPASRPLFFPDAVQNKLAENNYYNLEWIMAVAIFLDNADVHSGNVCVTKNTREISLPNGEKKIQYELANYDFGCGLKDLDHKLHFGSILRYLPGLGPTNHVRNYRRFLVNPEMAQCLDYIHNFNLDHLSDALDKVMAQVDAYFGIAPVIEFAKRIGYQVPNNQAKPAIIAGCKKFMLEKFEQRQQHAKKLTLQIRLSFLYDKLVTAKENITQLENAPIHDENEIENNKIIITETNEQLDKLIADNHAVFLTLLKTGKRFHFRGESQEDEQRYLTQDLRKRIKRNSFIRSQILQSNAKRVRKKIDGVFQAKVKPAVIDGERHFYKHFYKPYSTRVAKSFHEIFNDGDKGRLIDSSGLAYYLKSFLGFSSVGRQYNPVAVWVLTALSLIGSVPKNTAKLLAEFLPATIEHAGALLADNCEDYLDLQSLNRNPLYTSLAYTGLVLGLSVTYFFKTLRLLTMRITSPVRSMWQAYDFGEMLGEKIAPGNKWVKSALGYTCSALSLAVTAVGFVGVSILAAPIVAAVSVAAATTAVGAKVLAGITTMGNSIATLPVIGKVLHAAGAYATTSLAAIGLKSIAGLAITTTTSKFAVAVATGAFELGLLAKTGVGAAWKWIKGLSVVPKEDKDHLVTYGAGMKQADPSPPIAKSDVQVSVMLAEEKVSFSSRVREVWRGFKSWLKGPVMTPKVEEEIATASPLSSHASVSSVLNLNNKNSDDGVPKSHYGDDLLIGNGGFEDDLWRREEDKIGPYSVPTEFVFISDSSSPVIQRTASAPIGRRSSSEIAPDSNYNSDEEDNRPSGCCIG